ncbi:hypothetical protein PoB_000064600 [Plakobranchus ocellatus]|uniref:Chitin-binding type-2 domain-containing protein n=1 Tax=Plakobranchus ocellatus TaxID=259542 RepID=A0AAV3XVR1_9GAST|nr:hypothetical protein PoB_000064600 [Plakobranchus ocellatus]
MNSTTETSISSSSTTPTTSTAEETTTPESTTLSTTATTSATSAPPTTTTFSKTTSEPTTTATSTTTPATTITQKSTTTEASTMSQTTKSTTAITELTSSMITTTVDTTTTQPQYIFITAPRGLLHTATNITCLWTHDQPYGVIVLEAVDIDLGIQTVMVAFRDDGQHGSFYPELFTSSVRQRPEGHLLITTIKNTTCSDASTNLLYRCSVKDNIRQRDATPLFLEIPADVTMTSPPPRYVIERALITVSCEATVQPGGDISLTRRGQTGNTFERMTYLTSDLTTLADDDCYRRLSRTFSIVTEVALNGTNVRCESEQPEGRSNQYLILVIPESLCSSISRGNQVAHPYEASMYVECSDQEPRLIVRNCSPGFVFDIDKVTCVDPYAATVTLAQASIVEGSDLELFCLVNEGNYTTISLLKIDATSSQETLLASFTVDGRNQVESSRVTASRSALPAPLIGTEFQVTLQNAACTDAGSYFCRHDNGQTSTRDVQMLGNGVLFNLSHHRI